MTPEDKFVEFFKSQGYEIVFAEDAFSDSQTDIGVFEGATVAVDKIKIMRGNDDITPYFDITVIGADLTVIPDPERLMDITLQPEDVYGGTYDGVTYHGATTLLDPDGTIQGLKDLGYEFKVVYSDKVKNAGEHTSSIVSYAIYFDGRDVTEEQFRVTTLTGKITIDKYVVDSISLPATKEFDYDGKAHTLTVSDCTVTLPDGHTLVMNFSDTVTNAESKVISVVPGSILVYFEGDDVSNNFDIVYPEDTCTVTVNKFDLSIIFTDKTKYYDGTALKLTENDYTISPEDKFNELFGNYGYTIVFGEDAFCDSQTQVGVFNGATVALDSIKIMRGEDNVTSNFNISVSSATLTVLATDDVKLILQPKPVRGTYDGETVYSASDLLDSDGFLAELEALGYTIEPIFSEGYVEAGTYTSTIVSHKVYYNGEDVTANFAYEYVDGEIVIEKIKLDSIVLPSYKDQYYTGEALGLTLGDCTFDLDGKYTLTMEFTETLTDVGTTTVSVVPGSIKIFLDGVDVTDNFDIIYPEDECVLEVKRRVITITTGTASKFYDGKELTNSSYTVFDSEQNDIDTICELLGIDLTVEAIGTITNVGSVVNTAKVFLGGVELDVSWGSQDFGNYEIVYDFGTLTVKKVVITITTGSDSKLYDGKELTNSNYEISDYGSLDIGLTVTPIGTITNVGSVENVAEVILNGVALDVSWGSQDFGNYEIVYNFGTLTVEKRVITVTTGNASKFYDGQALTKPKYTVFDSEENSIDTICDILGIDLTVEVIGTITNVGSVANTAKVFLDGVELDVSLGSQDFGNYEIVYDFGTLTVKKVVITITTGSDSKLYDGKELTNSKYTVSDTEGNGIDKLYELFGIELTVNPIGTITAIGSAENVAEVTLNGVALDVSLGSQDFDNYEIVYNFGTLKVDKRIITITTGSSFKVYDGTALTNSNYTVFDNAENDLDALCELLGAEITVRPIGTITNIGTTLNTVEVLINGIPVDVSSGTQDFGSYKIECDFGTLEVGKRIITVTTGSASKFEDGTPLTNLNYTLVDNEGNDMETLIKEYGFIIDVNVTGTITYVGSVENTVEVTIDGVDMNNIEIRYELGTLKVLNGNVKPLRVKVASASKSYDGTPLVSDLMFMVMDEDFKVANYTLTLRVVMPGNAEKLMASDVHIFNGQKVNYLQFTVMDGDTDITGQYYLEVVHPLELDEDYVIAEILQSDIKLKTGSSTQRYSEGKKLTNSSVVLSMGQLAEGDELIINHNRELTELTEVGSVSNKLYLSDIMIRNAAGENVTNNYNIIIEMGTLEFLE